MVYGLLFVVIGAFGTLYSFRLLARGERREKWLTYLLSSAMLLAWGTLALSPLRTALVRWLHGVVFGDSAIP